LYAEEEVKTDIAKRLYQWVHLGCFLPSLRGKGDIRAVWLEDSKPYWREEIFPEYKCGRSRAYGEDYYLAVSAFQEMGLPLLAYPGQEADDLAMAVVENLSLLHRPVRTFLITADSDWMGLVRPDVWFIEVYGRNPQMRGKVEVWNWLRSRYNKASKKRQRMWGEFQPLDDFDCRKVYDWKILVGDPGDNVPPGAPELIDLFNPPDKFNILKDEFYGNNVLLPVLSKSLEFSLPLDRLEVERDVRAISGTPIPYCPLFVVENERN
jgi:hypothetical protein